MVRWIGLHNLMSIHYAFNITYNQYIKLATEREREREREREIE